MRRKLLDSLVCAALVGVATGALGQAKISDDVVKIGVLTDLSGIYSDLSGPGSVLAARMAIEDFAKDGRILGKPIELVSADTQNKPDVASTQARRWWDQEKVDTIVDVVATNVALAVLELGKQKNKITLMSGPASLPITNENCTATNVHWMYDTYALSVGTGNALVKQGGKSWFFITADYAFGANLEKDTTAVVVANGGKVVGSIRHPFPNSSGDFASFLLKAQASKAEVIALANAGGDAINTVKQAAEFGITSGGQKLAPLLMFLTDVHSLGLKAAQGMYLTEGFYWDQDEAARAWSKRFFEQHKRMPTMIQAGVYSAVLNYLRAIQAAKTDDTAAVMKQLKSMPIEDPVIRKGRIREDGRLVHDMLLLQVKKPSESKGPWDYYHVRSIIPGDEAFQPLSMSRCPLVKK